MNIEMVDLRSQNHAIRKDIDNAIGAVLESTAFIRGPEVGEFECKLAGYLEGSFALGVGNGTDALQIAMMALGIGRGDEIITTSFTFIATAEAAALLGANPVFADIDPQTFNLDPTKIEDLITDHTKAIVPVHLFGQPADMDSLVAIAKKYGLALIEDNAQGIGSEYKGVKTGYIGDIGCLSFFPSKNLGCFGDGGAVLTNVEALYRKSRMIANHGSEKKYNNEIVGVNSRLDTLQAAILKVKLQHLDEYTAARRRAAARYNSLFEDNEFVTTPHHAPDRTHVYHQYTLRISEDVPGGRDRLSEHLRKKNIPHAVYYPVPLHRLPIFAEEGACRCGDMTETEAAAREAISLPMHTELTDEQQEYIARCVLEFIEQESHVI
jgi:dTDP-4-amino-4,6-dideoxygalactose transaminase